MCLKIRLLRGEPSGFTCTLVTDNQPIKDPTPAPPLEGRGYALRNLLYCLSKHQNVPRSRRGGSCARPIIILSSRIFEICRRPTTDWE